MNEEEFPACHRQNLRFSKRNKKLNIFFPNLDLRQGMLRKPKVY